MALTSNDGRKIMGMVARGDKHHDIAAYFGENQARVAEVVSGQAFGNLPTAPADELPPKGAPGVKGRRIRASVKAAVEALENGDTVSALDTLKAAAARYDKHE